MANAIQEAFTLFLQRTKADFQKDATGTPARVGASPGGTPFSKQNFPGTLADLMYAYARGKKDELQEKIIDKFRASQKGQELIAETKRQEFSALLKNPTIWIFFGAVTIGLIFIGTRVAGRRVSFR